MNLIQCANGHYYDGDKFSSCPHCKGGAASSSEESVTISYDSTANPTVDTGAAASSPTIKEVTSNQNTANTNAAVKLSTAPTAPIVQPLMMRHRRLSACMRLRWRLSRLWAGWLPSAERLRERATCLKRDLISSDVTVQ